MHEFRVTWDIDVDTDNPISAAMTAFTLVREPDSTATVFDVTGPDNRTYRIDLNDDPPAAHLVSARPPHPA